MSGFLYWPYDEVSLEASESRDSIVVRTPWLEAKVSGPIEPQADFEELFQKFQAKQLGPKDISLVSWFFSNFEEYPLSYILPFPKEIANPDSHSIKDNQFDNATLAGVILAGLQAENKRSPAENEKMVADTLKHLPRAQFCWDIEAALAFSKQGTQASPETVFTVARRYHLLELLENDKGKEIFGFVENLPKSEFAKVASLIVKQNLYVTEQCESALSPALENAKSARTSVLHFIQQERGHDRLLGMAMQSLVPEPEAIPVSASTIALMSLLKFCAQRNFLAFAIAVDFFERSSYEKMDPLAQLLLKGGFEDAAKQINRHKEINDLGGHENMGLQFLAPMASCDPQYVREALKLAEAVSIVMNSVSRAAIYLK